MSHTTVLVIMDAGRVDYVRPDTMPFVHALAQKSMRGSFHSPQGFSHRSIIFSGQYPDTAGSFSAYVYDPDNSPFRWVRRLGPIGGLVRPRRAMVPARWAIDRTTRLLSGTAAADPAWIPTRFLPYFRPADDMGPIHAPGALKTDTIFDLCRRHDRSFRYLAPPEAGNDQEIHDRLVRELRVGADIDLHVAHFSLTHDKGRLEGPFSPAMQQRYLRDIDEKVASIHAALSGGYDTWDLLLCGDHGIGPVERKVNILAALDRADARPGKDYVVFVNSTMAAFWYHTPKGLAAIERILPHIEGTRVIEDDERRQMRIPTDRAWGDRLLAAQPGVLFWPDYFHVANTKILATHGYLDKTHEADGLALLASNNGHTPPGDMGRRPLVDIFPTICDLINVPRPAEQEGTSLLDGRQPIRTVGPTNGSQQAQEVRHGVHRA